jgi:hypothetical protein
LSIDLYGVSSPDAGSASSFGPTTFLVVDGAEDDGLYQRYSRAVTSGGTPTGLEVRATGGACIIDDLVILGSAFC